jgi:hypothetical protein
MISVLVHCLLKQCQLQLFERIFGKNPPEIITLKNLEEPCWQINPQQHFGVWLLGFSVHKNEVFKRSLDIWCLCFL